MKMTCALLAASLTTAGLANAATTRPLDLNALSPSPESIQQALAPKYKRDKDKSESRKERRQYQDDQKTEPKACTDAAITDDQKALIESAAFETKKEQIQQKADLKIAMMGYAQTVMDPATDKAAADTAAMQVTEGANKIMTTHLAFANKVFYDILQPTQRKNAFMCMLAKMKKYHKKGRY